MELVDDFDAVGDVDDEEHSGGGDDIFCRRKRIFWPAMARTSRISISFDSAMWKMMPYDEYFGFLVQTSPLREVRKYRIASWSMYVSAMEQVLSRGPGIPSGIETEGYASDFEAAASSKCDALEACFRSRIATE